MGNMLLAAERPATPMATRARFASYHLLHVLCHHRDFPTFQTLLSELVDFDDRSRSTTLDRIPASEPCIRFVLDVFRIHLTNDYARLANVLSSQYRYDKFGWIIVKSSLGAARGRAWDTLKSSYVAVSDREWLARSLLLKNESELKGFLQDQQWQDKQDDNGAILLKKAK